MRGRKIAYDPREGTRPMKHRVRQATFDLVGPAVLHRHAIDLFAGSGALGLEAISRGAVFATLVEQHVPTAQLIRKNIATLGLQDRTEVITHSAFIWVQRGDRLPVTSLPDTSSVIFCCPPYDFYVERTDEMLELIQRLMDRAPDGSILVVEADQRFEFRQLPDAERWDVRCYPPAVLGIYELKTESGVRV